MAALDSGISLLSKFIVFLLLPLVECELLESCGNLGFTSNLLCSACHDLKPFNLSTLSESCEQCCIPDLDDKEEKNVYPYARLEVCGWKLGRFPQIESFVKGEERQRFQSLQVKYVRGSNPVIKLLDSKKEIVEEVSVEKWNTDSIVEFLSEHLTK